MKDTETIKPEQSPLVGVGAVILRGADILLVKRGHEPGRGLWSLPGGRVRWGESPQTALEREVLEETGLTVKSERLAGVTDLQSEGYHYILIDYFCSIVSGEIMPGSDADACLWSPISRISELGVTEGLEGKLREWLS